MCPWCGQHVTEQSSITVEGKLNRLTSLVGATSTHPYGSFDRRRTLPGQDLRACVRVTKALMQDEIAVFCGVADNASWVSGTNRPTISPTVFRSTGSTRLAMMLPCARKAPTSRTQSCNLKSTGVFDRLDFREPAALERSFWTIVRLSCMHCVIS